MDLITNGPSEENRLPKFDLNSIGKPKKIDINDLPLEFQEEIRNMMEMSGTDVEPEIFSIEVTVDVHNLDMLPIEMLGNMLKESIQEEDYEIAETISDAIKQKNYSIEITDKKLLLQYMKDNGKI
jgi:hypothetical protein